MSPRQKELVRQSFALIAPKADITALMFYQRLFAVAPRLRALFHTDIERQATKLVQALTWLVASLDDSEQVRTGLEAMGRRHVQYGVREEHYDIVGAALLWAFERVLANEFTAEVREAWEAAYSLMAETMKRAAAEVPIVSNPASD